jgi:hypothetical protein
MTNRWRLGGHPAVTLPADRTWSENPLSDSNWQFLDHSLMIVHSLFRAWIETGEVTFRDRGVAILQDWSHDNPRTGGRSVWAWNDHSAALRAVVLACVSLYLPMEPWLESALLLHGRTLADPAFYVNHGNHALNQMIGLLEVGAVVGRSDWMSLARGRMSVLAAESIDTQGVTNEQSVAYQAYNYSRYNLARARLLAHGLTPPASFGRVPLMTNFLGYAILPNGEYDMLGDTDRAKGPAIPGTWAEYSATQGRSGVRPPDTVGVYRAGFAFARTGWGDRRAFTDEMAISLRWGPAPFIHGHADHGSVTVYGYGSRLIVDPGKYSYNSDPYRVYFKGRTAHNVVTVDGVTWSKTARSDLLSHSRNSTMFTARVRLAGNAGVSHVRGVVFSRNLGYTLVEDRLSSTVSRTYRQLWHLTEDARPYVQPWHFRTQRTTRGNVQVRQLLITGTSSRVLTGRTSPIQGWLAYEYGNRLPAPVVEFRRAGSNVRFLTLIVPAPGTAASGVSELKLTSTGYSVVIKVGSKRERVVVSGTSVSITPLP